MTTKWMALAATALVIAVVLSSPCSEVHAQVQRAGGQPRTGRGSKPTPRVGVLGKTTSRPTLTAQQVFSKFRASVVTVKTVTGLGTGFYYGVGVLTCFHVVDGSRTVSIEQPGVPSVDLTRMWACSKEADAAYLDVQTPMGIPLKIARQPDLKVGDPLFVIGNPQGLTQSITEGILSGRRTVGGVEFLQLSAAVSPGSSGSPVFDRWGNVVAIVTGAIKDGQQLNFAVTMDSVISRLQGVPLDFIFRSDVGLNLANPEVLKLLSIAPNNLQNSPDLSIEVAELPDSVAGVMTKDEVRRWIEAELRRSAPSLSVIDDVRKKQRLQASDPTDLQSILGRADDISRSLRVVIGVGTSLPAKVSWDSVHLEFWRGGLLPSGLAAVCGWTKGMYGAFGEIVTAQAELQEQVQRLVKDFADDWSKANKRVEK